MTKQYDISIGCDHAGLSLARELSVWLFDIGHTIYTFFPPEKTKVDYPDYAYQTSASVTLASHTISRGILICGSGVGMSIAANRFKGIRCVLASDPYVVEMARRHNDVNMLALGARVIGSDMAVACVEAFLNTAYEGGRHEQRVMKLFNVIKD
jgi:ribose 5-phosphate isomerase B